VAGPCRKINVGVSKVDYVCKAFVIIDQEFEGVPYNVIQTRG